MSTHAAPAKPAKTVPFIERHYFLLRRLHSLSGVAPIGLFLFPHLTTNSSIVWGSTLNKGKFGDMVAQYGSDAAGVATFQHEVDFIHNLPALVFIEIFVLWLPIAFHAILGVYFARTGRSNVDRYAYQGNYRYWLQRMTGYVGVAFIFAHVSSLRWGWTYGGLLPTFDAAHAASSTAQHMQDGLLGGTIALLYLFSVLCLVFHFANGLWTAAITWGPHHLVRRAASLGPGLRGHRRRAGHRRHIRRRRLRHARHGRGARGRGPACTRTTGRRGQPLTSTTDLP